MTLDSSSSESSLEIAGSPFTLTSPFILCSEIQMLHPDASRKKDYDIRELTLAMHLVTQCSLRRPAQWPDMHNLRRGGGASRLAIHQTGHIALQLMIRRIPQPIQPYTPDFQILYVQGSNDAVHEVTLVLRGQSAPFRVPIDLQSCLLGMYIV